ncbi:hypothetical protein BS78_05G188300 [Paspalum vaginatum]|nr:hypothetical protein BS78_05G188300 [Paspalum vaginatum]
MSEGTIGELPAAIAPWSLRRVSSAPAGIWATYPVPEPSPSGCGSRFWALVDGDSSDEEEPVEEKGSAMSTELFMHDALEEGFSVDDICRAEASLPNNVASPLFCSNEFGAGQVRRARPLASRVVDAVADRRMRAGKPWQGPLPAKRVSPCRTLGDVMVTDRRASTSISANRNLGLCFSLAALADEAASPPMAGTVGAQAKGASKPARKGACQGSGPEMWTSIGSTQAVLFRFAQGLCSLFTRAGKPRSFNSSISRPAALAVQCCGEDGNVLPRGNFLEQAKGARVQLGSNMVRGNDGRGSVGPVAAVQVPKMCYIGHSVSAQAICFRFTEGLCSLFTRAGKPRLLTSSSTMVVRDVTVNKIQEVVHLYREAEEVKNSGTEECLGGFVVQNAVSTFDYSSDLVSREIANQVMAMPVDLVSRESADQVMAMPVDLSGQLTSLTPEEGGDVSKPLQGAAGLAQVHGEVVPRLVQVVTDLAQRQGADGSTQVQGVKVDVGDFTAIPIDGLLVQGGLDRGDCKVDTTLPTDAFVKKWAAVAAIPKAVKSPSQSSPRVVSLSPRVVSSVDGHTLDRTERTALKNLESAEANTRSLSILLFQYLNVFLISVRLVLVWVGQT